jgi:hypothetical protein
MEDHPRPYCQNARRHECMANHANEQIFSIEVRLAEALYAEARSPPTGQQSTGPTNVPATGKRTAHHATQ